MAISVAKKFDSSRGYLLSGKCAHEEIRVDVSQSHVSTGECAASFSAILMYKT